MNLEASFFDIKNSLVIAKMRNATIYFLVL